ncbi:ABC transporter permease [Vogesella indigofera]|uniref:ABC transporter permease n=1 Tax=Vogesella indigofera TaxID=45465 RepID=UPI00234D13A0|nr:ABC transporter permease [Vogesella indigofera]MDC7705590.1 ABC transporter permease [Vogesella indigofera]
MTPLTSRAWPQRLGYLLLAAVLLFALAGPLLWPDYAGQQLMRFLEPASLAEPLGRDQLGRSVIARLASAARLSLWLAGLCVLSAAVLGCLLGVLSAWRGGWTDTVLRGLADGVLALPGLLIVLIFSAMAQGGFFTLYLGLALAQWVEYFRMTRARSRLLLASPHVEASRLLGFGPAYIVRRHLWPELAPMLLTMMSFGLATAILALSTLGFVGVGIQPPTPELGLMMTEALPHYSEAPQLLLAPVTVLATTLAALVLLRPLEATP